MKTSDKGVAALVLHEGVVPGPYLDSVGVWTYGVGHTASAGAPDPKTMDRGMPMDLDAELAEIFHLFRKDLAKYEARVNAAIKVPLKQHEFDAAVSFDYNTGGIHRASWVKSLNAGDRNKAISQIMNWTKPPEIIERRRSEQKLFANGIYPTGKATVWGVSETGRVIWKPVRRVSVSDIIPSQSKSSQTEPSNVLSGIIRLIQSILRMFK